MKSLLGTALALAVLSLTGCASMEGSTDTAASAREKPQYDEPMTGSRLPTRRSSASGTN
ncbi:hypothetical protein ACFFKC_04320 [Pseudoduganella danionis]|uniref:Lipoprotein n=1 Tax=Pseudoduganella danionis TaxID=1890295 RepID=A0ABW9SGV9_9BURK|nr:hypothetical protein [Pseudoduganella danionis]MTW31262.1 hypothetical protein [Pseudoduganella danionis]